MINNDAYLKAIDSMLENGDVQSPSGLMLLAYLREFRPPEFGYDGPADVCMTSRKICKAIEDMRDRHRRSIKDHACSGISPGILRLPRACMAYGYGQERGGHTTSADRSGVGSEQNRMTHFF